VPSLPNPPIVSSDLTNCQEVKGADMNATASSGGTLVWSSDNTFTTILAQGTNLTPASTLGITTYYVREELNGCYGESSLINITVKYCDIDLPSAFTPDGDNVNDSWVLPHIDEIYPNNIVSIYNRWGIKVFESPKGQYESHKWDGKYNDKALPVDSYFFIIEYNDSSKPTTNGKVTIVLQNK
jgi:gliding motility-associated-like protein